MTTEVHADRSHSAWSASATESNWRCSGRMAMLTIAPPDQESIYAAQGTAAHEVADRALRTDKDCIEFLGEIVKTKEFEIEIDEEIANGAQIYVDYVRGIRGVRTINFLEQKFSLESLNPPFDAGGTCDSIVINPDTGVMEVTDLKFGRGVVEALENQQLRTYGLLALLNIPRAHADSVETIRVTIVQPRAPHRDGIIRSDNFHISTLIEWTHELLKRMHRSKQALDEFEALNGNRVLFDEWAEKWLEPGSCKFCPAEAMCPARRKQALAITSKTAQDWFEDPTAPQPVPVGNAPALMSPEQLAHTLDGLDALEDWISAVRGYAHSQAERGVKLPGYQLVEKISKRKWAFDDKTISEEIRKHLGAETTGIYDMKLKSPAQMEKAFGVKAKPVVAKLTMTEVTGTNLVATNKTTREPAKSKAETFFEDVK